MKQNTLFPEENMLDKKSWFAEALHSLAVRESPGWPDVFGSKYLKHHTRSQSEEIRVLSLFSGGGGLDIGFHDAGFKIVECNELEKDFAATLSLNSTPRHRLFGSKIICMDINDYDPDIKDIDFIIGGPPCQTFSAAGARAAGVNGTDDDRGNLFRQYVRILEKLKPKGFLFENVYRIVGAQGGKPWKLIQEAFEEVGYKLHWRILDAADYGVPQFRERLIIVGLRDGHYQFPYPTHGPDSKDNRPFYSAKRATEGIIFNGNKESIVGRHGHLLEGIPPGLNYSFYTERMGHPTPYFGWRSKFSDYLYKADPDTPVRTIKAQGGQYTGPFHWDSRKFTIEELKRLQTFPDNYEINGNRQKIIHQLGNSVPPQMARILALSIAQQVFGSDLPFEIELLPDSYQLGFRARKSRLTKVYAEKAKKAIEKLPMQSEILSIHADYITDDYYKLMPNFTLESTSSNDWDYSFKYKIEDGEFELVVKDTEEHNEVRYQYLIQPKIKSKTNTLISRIVIHSYSCRHSSITALWKYLERIIQKILHKDDLVQFFGYYQYSNNYSISLEVIDPKLKSDCFWLLLTHISEGTLVGSIQSLTEFTEIYGVSEPMLVEQLRSLKDLGYEIRNKNTNRQIKDGKLLIPYSFPSLNERSLQRLTEL